MNIYVTAVFVDDQSKALEFYTETLGFTKKQDIPLGQHRWLTVTGKGEPNGVELLLEPSQHPAVLPFKKALMADGIPAASFRVSDLDGEYGRLARLGVRFVQAPMLAGPVMMAVFDDTCGNLIQLVEVLEEFNS